MISVPAVDFVTQLSGHGHSGDVGTDKTDVKPTCAHETKVRNVLLC
jgi:hypothetical protein